jgi:hypothetical protein
MDRPRSCPRELSEYAGESHQGATPCQVTTIGLDIAKNADNNHPNGTSLPGAGAVHHIISDILHCGKTAGRAVTKRPTGAKKYGLGGEPNLQAARFDRVWCALVAPHQHGG